MKSKKVLTFLFVVLIISCLSTNIWALANETENNLVQIPPSYKEGGESWTDSAIVYKGQDVLNCLIDPRADGFTEFKATQTTETSPRETYNPKDRRWQGLVSLVKVENRLWSAWYTGGLGEPSQLNYCVMAYSDDEGKTWVDPYYIIDHPDINKIGISIVVPNLWVDSDGKMWLFYQQSGTWGIKFDNAGASDINSVTYSSPRRLGNFKTNQPPTAYTNEDGQIEWGFCSETTVGSSDVSKTYLYVSKDKGLTWRVKSSIVSSAFDSRRWPETMLVELSEGNLMMTSRLEKGSGNGMEVTTSNDYGKTWNAYKFGLDEPFKGPGSKMFIYKLSNGNIVMLNHAITSNRSDLKVYLSTNSGESFDYSMMLDSRSDVSYPYAYEQNGKIYASWDKGRYVEKEMRLSIFTEQDIINGFIANEDNKMIIISQTGETKDITSIKTSLNRNLDYVVGTESSKIKESLPTSITVLDSQNKEFILNGTWSSKGYKSDKIGQYIFYFETEMPNDLADPKELLSVKITLKADDNKGGCFGNLYGDQTFLVALLSIATMFLLNRKKEKIK